MQIEQPEVKTRETLPDAFSPRRRGTKDVPGGLAAELRNWLIDIEAKTGPKSDKDFIAKLYVEGFRRGQGMVLINGQTITDCAPAQEPRSNPSVKVMLAGEGRLLGLARRNEIRIGSHVTIAKPTWEVNMGIEGRWVVACDWVVS